MGVFLHPYTSKFFFLFTLFQIRNGMVRKSTSFTSITSTQILTPPPKLPLPPPPNPTILQARWIFADRMGDEEVGPDLGAKKYVFHVQHVHIQVDPSPRFFTLGNS